MQGQETPAFEDRYTRGSGSMIRFGRGCSMSAPSSFKVKWGISLSCHPPFWKRQPICTMPLLLLTLVCQRGRRGACTWTPMTKTVSSSGICGNSLPPRSSTISARFSTQGLVSDSLQSTPATPKVNLSQPLPYPRPYTTDMLGRFSTTVRCRGTSGRSSSTSYKLIGPIWPLGSLTVPPILRNTLPEKMSQAMAMQLAPATLTSRR